MIFLTKYALSLSFSLSLIHTCSHSHSLTLTDLGRVNRASTKSVINSRDTQEVCVVLTVIVAHISVVIFM